MHDINKNVSGMTDQYGQLAAVYEYTPFGGVIQASGPMAQENEFGFSSEYRDDELGLIYYNYRHYNPTDGRWISRDPINEQGGWNLYGFVYNSPIYISEVLGQWGFIGALIGGIAGAVTGGITAAVKGENIVNGITNGAKAGAAAGLVSPTPLAGLTGGAAGIAANHDRDAPSFWRDHVNYPWETNTPLERDYTNWMYKRIPKNMENAEKAISASVKKRIEELCYGKSNTIDDLSKIRYAINPSDWEKYGDKPIDPWERFFQIGAFSLYVKNVKITWIKSDCSYKWEATMYAEEKLGRTPVTEKKANILDYIAALPPYSFFTNPRKEHMGEIPLTGNGKCHWEQK